ncbi:MAG: PilN domain-containing protein [Nitrospirae bacterium]|nr:PilN domain-containing protein [Nitrospirota bacterium]
MIKINLLPYDGKSKKRKKPPAAIPIAYAAAVLVFVFSLIGAGLYFKFLSDNVIMKQREKTEKTKALADLKEKTKGVTALEAQIKTINENKAVIEQLRANQSIPVRVLDEICKRLPDRVWLTNVKLPSDSQKYGILELTGNVENNFDYVSFFENLRNNSKLFTDVTTISSESRASDKRSLYEFRVGMNIAGYKR